ncbi:MAG: hypothetical protein GY928_16570 [Colwellia sp.]|nr:hypothetical protein [Colwellia sp.]
MLEGKGIKGKNGASQPTVSGHVEPVVSLLTPRERYLMKAAMDAAPYYADLDQWLNESASDCGHIVEQLLDDEANRAN